MQHFTKVVRLGTLKRNTRQVSVFCKIQYKDSGTLSLSGVEGPTPNGNCYGACGQINMHLRGHESCIAPAPGWDLERLQKFFSIWARWHLNDMRAGSPAQEEFLRTHAAEWETYKAEAGSITSHYTWACKVLAAAGLHPDPGHNDYRYGSAWLREEVPKSVLARAGSPAQEEFLRAHAAEWETYKAEAGSITSHYAWACKVLAAAGLHPDPGHNDYRYGSAWLREEVPEGVLAWLYALPDTDVVPAWV